MFWQLTTYALAAILIALMVAAGVAYVWRRRPATGAAAQPLDSTALKHTEMALRESQQRLEAQSLELSQLYQAVAQSANMIVITDVQGNIEYVNPRFEEVTGYTAGEVMGSNPSILKSGEQGEAFYRELWQTIISGQAWEGEFHNRRKDGTTYWERSTIAPIVDSAGQTTHFVAIKEDITSRKEAEEGLKRNSERLRIQHEIGQAILAARLPETIAVAAIGRIRRLIPCQRALVMAIEETGQLKLLAAESGSEIELVADIDAYEEAFQKRALRSGWVHGVEDLATLAEHSPMQQALCATGIRSYVIVPLFIQDELVGILNLESVQPKAFTTDDISIATEVAASLAIAIRQARLYELAQQEIAERMQAEEALRQYAGELEIRNAELDAFAHTVAHDLKNPVSNMVGYAELLAQEHDSLPAQTLEEFLQTLARNGRKMGTIIDELLLLSSVRGMGEIKARALDMGRIVNEALARLRNAIEECEGEVVLPDDWPTAMGYAPWIEEVWVNYIGNALKYGGRPPRLELGYTVPDRRVRSADPLAQEAQSRIMDPESTAIYFWVRDNGPGLSPEERSRLFTPFERLHQVHAEGHGLGLSIVRRIVQKLGGQVGVQSHSDWPGLQEGRPARGSVFFFSLPAVPTDSS